MFIFLLLKVNFSEFRKMKITFLLWEIFARCTLNFARCLLGCVYTRTGPREVTEFYSGTIPSYLFPGLP